MNRSKTGSVAVPRVTPAVVRVLDWHRARLAPNHGPEHAHSARSETERVEPNPTAAKRGNDPHPADRQAG